MAGKRTRGADLAQARQALNEGAPPASTASPTPNSAYWTEEATPPAGQDEAPQDNHGRGRACERRRRAFLGWSSQG
ncbi:hypothetical protein ABZ791_37875 [Streptomyces huasconensis]|uniref:Uncharacterized protein n=1 Tax=Streptomyces huasconensis TaxID=1854574 RepID=A0ABV3M772_9ACTN